ncbi:hypothetical protein [Nonomuraea turcica]|uniref:hypothetical protein n=1 Tax=Nonomuraea sp. G32 TaxID=3067274 RepID=UPI00273BC9E5|nr:hypothetical protein [Nonomuraea sp. G32]MDP4505301.1 hypothetical protein [Nonomuraea sp. G32]
MNTFAMLSSGAAVLGTPPMGSSSSTLRCLDEGTAYRAVKVPPPGRVQAPTGRQAGRPPLMWTRPKTTSAKWTPNPIVSGWASSVTRLRRRLVDCARSWSAVASHSGWVIWTGVEGVAVGDHPLPAGADHVGGVSCAVAWGEHDADAGEDLLALAHGAHLRLHGLLRADLDVGRADGGHAEHGGAMAADGGDGSVDLGAVGLRQLREIAGDLRDQSPDPGDFLG